MYKIKFQAGTKYIGTTEYQILKEEFESLEEAKEFIHQEMDDLVDIERIVNILLISSEYIILDENNNTVETI